MTTENDFLIFIATAKNRFAKTWRNRQVRWSEFVAKCSKTKRTDETIAEYFAMPKDRQSDIKDVGGFVGGYLREGQRKKGHVEFRTMVTLDIDDVTADVWDDFKLLYSCEALIYSTHKHKADTPRYRLVIPLDRQVSVEEYEPIARRIADDVGIEQFDTTTYQAQRLFYWPSTSKDGEWYFHIQHGERLSADEVLSSYHNFRDVSEYPTGSKEGEVIKRDMREVGDPTQKRGLIGAFCREYSIEEAIDTFLPDIYKPTHTEGRYTYAQGSVAGGLVCYNGVFAYSHHDTDPAGGILCNAFDLVRIHKFGEEDKDKEYEDPTKRPSYRHMMEFISGDSRVKDATVRDAISSASEDFDGVELTEEGGGKKWSDGLPWETNQDGKLLSTARNLLLIFDNDPKLKGHLWLNEFNYYYMVEGGLPWDRHKKVWGNSDDSQLRMYMEMRYGIKSRDKIKDAKVTTFCKNKRHPIREYLQSLGWDGVKRLETMIIDYVGADDNELNRTLTRKHFTAAVARVMQPGIKYDYCLVLTGEEGIGKSTLFNIMGGDWFSDSLMTMEGKTAMEQVGSGWIIEMAELGGIKRSEVEQVKAFLSKQEDNFRPAYGEVVEHRPRQCVFCGTTNEISFLKGDKGNRRFWVIPVSGVKKKYEDAPERLQENRDQLWAEAYHYYKEGEKLYLDRRMELEARKVQEEYNDDRDDPVKDMLSQFLEQKLPVDWNTWDLPRRRAYYKGGDPLDAEATERRDVMCIPEFVCEMMGMERKDKEYKYVARKVGRYMEEREGWERKSTSRHAEKLYGIQKAFKRIVDNEEDEDL